MQQPVILDNKTNGKVVDVLKKYLHSGSRLSAISAYFSIYAFSELRNGRYMKSYSALLETAVSTQLQKSGDSGSEDFELVSFLLLLFNLSLQTINRQPYKDSEFVYTKIQIIEIALPEDNSVVLIAEFLIDAIPYTSLFLFRLRDMIELYGAHQRTNQNDASQNVLEPFVTIPWLTGGSPLFAKLDFNHFNTAKFFTLYADLLDTISIFVAEPFFYTEEYPVRTPLTGETARNLIWAVDVLDKGIAELKLKMKEETQFGAKAEKSMHLQELIEKRKRMTGGEHLCF